jgi:hypothetical protein
MLIKVAFGMLECMNIRRGGGGDAQIIYFILNGIINKKKNRSRKNTPLGFEPTRESKIGNALDH